MADSARPGLGLAGVVVARSRAQGELKWGDRRAFSARLGRDCRILAEPLNDALSGPVRCAWLRHVVPQRRQRLRASSRAAGSSSHKRAQRTSSSETSRHVRYSGKSSVSASRLTRLIYRDLMKKLATQRSNRLIL